MKVLSRAPTKDAILAWAKEQKGYPRAFEYRRDKNDVIVLLIDRGSGVRLDNIYVYGMSEGESEWSLVLFRPTDTEIKVQEEKETLVFSTLTGDVVLRQSFDAIGPFGDRVRRKMGGKGVSLEREKIPN